MLMVQSCPVNSSHLLGFYAVPGMLWFAFLDIQALVLDANGNWLTRKFRAVGGRGVERK